MANLDLSKYGITGVTEILHNPSYDVLFAEETKPGLEGFEKGQVTELGAVNVMTGIYTGRSPKDKFFVKNEASSVQGLLSFLYSSEVHHTEFSEASFLTKNLSLGERPV